VYAGGVADRVGATRASALRGSSTDLHRCRVLGLVVGPGEGRDQAVPSRHCSAMDWRTVGRSDGGRRASSAGVGRRHSSRRISRWSSSHVPQQQNRPGVLEVRTAEDPGPAAGDAGVVACGEAVAINDLGSAGRQADWLPIVPTTAGACWQTRGFLSSPWAWMPRAQYSECEIPAGGDSGSPGACHNVARCAEFWHENGSGLGRESRDVRIEFAKLTREIKWK